MGGFLRTWPSCPIALHPEICENARRFFGDFVLLIWGFWETGSPCYNPNNGNTEGLSWEYHEGVVNIRPPQKTCASPHRDWQHKIPQQLHGSCNVWQCEALSITIENVWRLLFGFFLIEFWKVGIGFPTFSKQIPSETWNWPKKIWETHTIHSHQRTVAQEGKRIPGRGRSPGLEIQPNIWDSRRQQAAKDLHTCRGADLCSMDVLHQNPHCFSEIPQEIPPFPHVILLVSCGDAQSDIRADSQPVKMLFTPNINQSARSWNFSAAKRSKHWTVAKNVFQARGSKNILGSTKYDWAHIVYTLFPKEILRVCKST